MFWVTQRSHTHLFHQQLPPFDRLRQTCQDLFGQPLSLGTLTQTHARAYQALAPVEAVIVRGLTCILSYLDLERVFLVLNSGLFPVAG